MFDIKSLVRPNILQLIEKMPPKKETDDKLIRLRLDANENPFNAPHNRYSNCKNEEVKEVLSNIKGIWPHCIALCNGTDEAIDFLFRIFCNPGKDNILALTPTARQYATYATLNDIGYQSIPLDEHFQISAEKTLSLCDENTKIIFLCSPNNPTGNLLQQEEIFHICDRFHGIVVVDEAYHEFSRCETMVKKISTHHNLVVLNTLSKAYASADLRLSIVYAIPDIITFVKAIIPHHHINPSTLQQSLEILQRRYDVEKWINQLLEERRKVIAAIKALPICEKVYPSDSNFFLVRFKNASSVYAYLRKEGIAVYDCSEMYQCKSCLRISIGLTNDNNMLIGALRKYQ